MNRCEVRFECLFKGFLPVAIEIAEPFPHETVKSRECAFLRTTFDNHVYEFHFLTFLDIDFHEFMTTFLVIH